MKNDVKWLDVYCPLCKWKGCLYYLQHHMKKRCPAFLIVCKYCMASPKRSNFQKHLNDECPSRQFLFDGYCRKMCIPQEIVMMIIKFVHGNFIWIKLYFANEKTGNVNRNTYEIRQLPLTYTLKEFAEDVKLCALHASQYSRNKDVFQIENEMDVDHMDKEMNMPGIHFWVKFGVIKGIYLVNKKNAKVTKEDLKYEDTERLVEIPDDWLRKIEICDTDIYEIVVEKKNKNGTWPRAKESFERDTLQTGDFVDICDTQNIWYEGLVRCVYPKSSDKYGKCAIHFVGWNAKWDEEIDIANCDRLAKRHDFSKGPYRDKKMGYQDWCGEEFEYRETYIVS